MYRARILRSTNRDRIIECIFRNPGISRKEISSLTGITPATVTTTSAALMSDGIIAETGQVPDDRGTIGRSRIALDICPEGGCAIGVECTLTALTACVTDLKGRILYTESEPYSAELRTCINDKIIAAIRSCMAHTGLPEKRLLGIGIAVPGHMDRQMRHLISNNDLWTGFDGGILRNAFSLPVIFENNVRCMAIARYLHDPQNTPGSFALLHVGRGMYCANFAEDELYIGTTYDSGEIAHTLAVPGGSRCECGKRGCLQTVATEAALLEHAAVLYRSDEQSALRGFARSEEELTIDNILTAYELGDRNVRTMLRQVLTHLSVAALNVAILMNPEQILLHGALFNHPVIRQDFLELIREQFDFNGNDHQPSTVSFCPACPADGAVGGAALAIYKYLIHA